MIYLGNQPIGVGIRTPGDLLEHKRYKVTPSASNELSFTHDLGVIPKIVMFTSQQAYVDTNYVYQGIFDNSFGVGDSLNDSIGTPNAYIVNLNTTGTANANAFFTENQIIIRRATSARYFNTNVEYTIDLYA